LFNRLKIALPETTDKTVLSRASVQAALVAGTDAVTLSALSIQLDDTSIKGKAGVSDFKNPSIRFDLTMGNIDLNAYLPPGNLPEKSNASKTGADAKPLQSETSESGIPNLNINGALTAEKIHVRDIDVLDLSLSLAGSDILRNQPLNIGLTYRMKSEKPSIEATPSLSAAARIDLENSRLRIDQFKLDTEISGVSAGGETTHLSLGTGLDLNWSTGDLVRSPVRFPGPWHRYGYRAREISTN